MTAVTLAFVALAPIASSMFGIGLANRFANMDLYKSACYVMVAAGIVGLVNFVVAMNAPGLGIQSLLLVNTLALYIQGICLIIIGYGMYRGQEELAEDSPDPQPEPSGKARQGASTQVAAQP